MEEWLDLIQPGWRAEVVEKQFLPHLQVTGGMVQARTGGLSAMPQPEHSGVANVFLVGDWIGSEAHLAGASFASARRAAQSVLQYTRQPVSV
ncbi:hypothetical protein EPA93_12320 [Ktedonosporobacter rubrisoli]|uniref:Amine oxidase domain-containing protein n=1 Tax=Ktedonosporobacter rubrisoli TaxID=2509675 RepID=A0A4P6JN75_KTERU|nr:hypothetical protein [Ktedonosporobacter rubrisoli]QBD76748.1 hypothetical protein EPA93_12320 [Ktedonosporobacter rubrisoli]